MTDHVALPYQLLISKCMLLCRRSTVRVEVTDAVVHVKLLNIISYTIFSNNIDVHLLSIISNLTTFQYATTHLDGRLRSACAQQGHSGDEQPTKIFMVFLHLLKPLHFDLNRNLQNVCIQSHDLTDFSLKYCFFKKIYIFTFKKERQTLYSFRGKDTNGSFHSLLVAKIKIAPL